MVYRGLAHQSISNATLHIVSSDLVISNAAAVASFGTSILLGDSDGGAITLGRLELPSAPQGSTVEIRSRGTVNGVPDQPIGTLRLAKLASSLRASVAHTPLGVSGAMAVVLDGSAVVDATEDFLSTDFPLALFARVAGIQVWASSGGLEEVIRFDDRQPISINGRSPVLGNRILIRSATNQAVPYPSSVQAVSRLDIVGAGLPSFRITDEELGKFRRRTRALGQARLLGVGDWVWMGNLVAGGAHPDGVEFPLAGKDAFTVYWRQLDRFGEVPPGAVLENCTVGYANGGLVPLLWSRVTSLGAQKEIVADFSALGSTSCRIAVLWTNVVVFSTSLDGARGLVARTTHWPAGLKGGSGQNESNNVYASWTWATPQSFDISNQSFQGDEVRVNAAPGEGYFGTQFSSIALQASGFNDISLVADIAEYRAPITAKLQAIGGVLVLSWDTADPGQILQSADNVDGPWKDVPGAVTSPCLVQPVGLQKFLRVIQR